MMHLEINMGLIASPPASSNETDGDAASSRGYDTEKQLHLRVLIVEDEGLVAMDMESALSEGGFEIVGVVDSEPDAISAAARLMPDVILMDITLREGNGISAARAIMKTSSARIIFVSGNSDPRTLEEVRDLNTAFIRKPFVTNTFAHIVRNLLSRRN